MCGGTAHGQNSMPELDVGSRKHWWTIHVFCSSFSLLIPWDCLCGDTVLPERRQPPAASPAFPGTSPFKAEAAVKTELQIVLPASNVNLSAWFQHAFPSLQVLVSLTAKSFWVLRLFFLPLQYILLIPVCIEGHPRRQRLGHVVVCGENNEALVGSVLPMPGEV